MQSADIRQDILHRLRQWRKRLALQRLVFTLTAASGWMAAALLLKTPLATLLLQLAVLLFVSFAQLLYSRKWRQLNADNFLQHLNRRFPDFEESAQLLIREDSDLSPMRRLQQHRAQAVYRDNLARPGQWQLLITYRLASAITLVFVLLALASNPLLLLAEQLRSGPRPNTSSARMNNVDTQITHIAINIQPPRYTGLPATESVLADLEVVEGSLVHWDLAFNSAADNYFLKWSDGQQIALSPDENNHWHVSRAITRTDLYRIIEKTAEQETPIGDIYSVTVRLDNAPDIRILAPDVVTLEIPKQGPARFKSRVLVKDDYAVQSAEILASVARGSGEGVKFRDQELTFDQSTATDKGVLYQREWDLQLLGMEPGDEIYFTVIATDNKQPAANTGRSETLIVRWLEDEQTGLAAAGLAIDFMPESFMSQRQIIIDTEQLIDDENNLESQAFKDTAYEIGHAQAGLKSRYGQYLGDEIGEGPGEHENEMSTTINTGIRTPAEILALFGHNHGDPEIGPLTTRNPVALMKRAVGEMWQAEKHLMQAEPEQALPFEYEAYKYLKLARQADRIYVKRLGFEPPPVTEERRLTGELDEILTYRTHENPAAVEQTGPRADQLLLRDAYRLLSTQAPMAAPHHQALLTRLSAHLMALSQQRPALIKHAATVEIMLQTHRWRLDACPDCAAELKTLLWNLMDEGDASLHAGKAAYYHGDDLIQSYQDELRKARQAPEDAGDDAR